MNFWKKTKRFLEPLWESRKNLILHTVIHVTYQIGKVIPVLLLILSQTTSLDIQFFLYVSIVYIWVGIILVRLLREYYWLRPGYSYLAFLTKKCTQDLIQKNNLAYEGIGTGRIMSIMERGIYVWHVLLANGFIFFVKTIIIGGFILVRMTTIKWEYGLLFLWLMIWILVWIIWNNQNALVWKKVLKEKESEHTRRLVKIFMSKFEILQNKKIESEQSWLQKNIQEQLETAGHRNIYLSYMYDVPYYGFLTGIVGIFCLSYFWWISIQHGLLVELIGIALLAQSMLLPYIDFIKDFSKDFVHIEKLWDFMDKTPQIEGYDQGKKFQFTQGNYELKNISFSYEWKNMVLSDFSLKIQGGKRTALVGRSGSGKTTLMKLLAGYMRPTLWELLIDEQNIVDIRLDSYYPHIGYLTQEPSVFDGTIEENLLFWTRKNPTKKDIERAIELSECQFIYELEHGVSTEIGERWVRLSGWQKQRLAIAKIFLKDPEIILLDEPTAALDSYSEQKVARAFEHLFQWRTVIVIAHRLQTVKGADDIIVMEKWRIVERWTHKKLLHLWGKYAGMVDLQSGFVREENETLESLYEA